MKNKTLIATAISLALTVTACSENKSPEQYIESAKELLAAKQIDTAIIELKNAVVQSPRNPEMRALLGKAYIDQGHYVAAEKELEKAVSLGYSESLITSLAFVKMKLNDADTVFELLESGNELPDEEFTALLVYAGITSLQAGEIEKGQDFFNQAVSINENAAYGQLAKAYLAQTNSEYDDALGLVEQILNNDAELTEPLLLKGNLLYGLKRYTEAADVFEKYNKKLPRAVYVKYFKINSLLRAGEFELAEQEVNWLLSNLKNAPLAQQYKAQIEYQKGNFPEAKRFGEQAIQGNGQLLSARMIAGLSAYQLKDIEQAYSHLRPLEQYVSNSHPVKKVLAVVKLELGYTDEAVATLADLNAESDSEFFEMANSELLSQANMPSTLSILTKAESLAPQNAMIKAKKGVLMLQAGDDAGVESLEQAIAIDPNLKEVETALALEYLAQNKDEKAKVIADKKVSNEKTKINGLLLDGVYSTKQRDFIAARKAFTQVLAIEPKNVAAIYNLAILEKHDGTPAKSIELLKQVLILAPQHEKAIEQLSELQFKSENLHANIKFLESLLEKNKESPSLVIGLAQNYRLNNEPNRAIAILESIKNAQVTSDAYWIALGDTYIQASEFEKAKDLYIEGLNYLPQSYMINMRLVGAWEMLNNFVEALKSARNAEKIFKENEKLQVLVAYLEFRNKNYEESNKLVQALLSNNVRSPLLFSVAGRLAMAAREYSKAIDLFSEAYFLDGSARNAMSLAQALAYSGKKKEAIKTLESYLANTNENGIMRMLLAELYEEHEYKKKNHHYSIILKEAPKNIVALNNLAWGQFRLGQYEASLQTISKAKAIRPDYIPVLETYGVILAESQPDNAAIQLADLVKKGSVDSYVLVTLAEIYLKQNKQQQANLLMAKLTNVPKTLSARVKQIKKTL